MTHDPKLRHRWMAMLAKLCAPADPVSAVAALIAMLPLLAVFPDEAFCDRSLADVAAKARRLPSYADLRGWLDEWWRANRPPPSLALEDNVTGLGPKERDWLAYWHRREAERFQPLREDDGSLVRPDIADWKAHTASLVRTYAPDAWQMIAEDEQP